MEDLRKKYQPQQTQLQNLAAEIDSLKKQLQAAPATLSDDEKATRAEDHRHQGQAVSTRLRGLPEHSRRPTYQEALGKVAQKVDVVMRKYVSDNGYTLLLNAGDQSSPVMWAATEPNADITMAIIEAYNAASKVAPLPPAAPAAAARPKPASTTTPRTSPAAKPAAK